MTTEADIESWLRREAKDRATARLIAAAPDMLAALQELADVSRAYLAHMDADDIAALQAARAAIAKATGVV